MLPALKTRESRLRPPTPMVRQMLLGTLLGDASLANTKDARYPRLRVVHGSPQEAYCRHKADVLRDYVRTPPRIVPNAGWGKASCVFSTATTPVFETLDVLCYGVNKEGKRTKTVSKEWASEIYWPAIAYWYMDDGTMQQKGVVQFSTHSFSEKEVRLLANRLGELGTPAIAEITKKGARGYWTIRMLCEPTRRFVEKVRPFIHESMLYKLSLPEQPERKACCVCGEWVSGGRRQSATFVSCKRDACKKEAKKRGDVHQYQKRKKLAEAYLKQRGTG